MSDYVSINEMKMTLELAGTNFANLDLDLAISAASRAVEDYTGRRFYADADTTSVRYYTPYQPRELWINDVITVATFQTDYDGDGTFETTWTENTDFLLAPYNNPSELGWPFDRVEVHPRSAKRFYAWPRSVKITGKFGWSSVPDPVKEATTILASRFIQRARSAPFGIVGTGMDVPGVRIPKVDPDVAMMLEPYVRGGGVLVC